MAQFALYHYELSPFVNKEPRLFAANDTSRQYHTMENLFESFLPARGGSLGVNEIKVQGSGDSAVTTFEPHGSQVLQNKNHIIAFRVQKNGKKKVETVDWEKEDVPHHPSVRVLIDNRPDRQLIAIENKSAFKADKAFELMKQHFNLKLHEHFVRFDCYPLLKKADFWDSVNEIKKRFKDFVKRVQFDFIREQTNTSKKFADSLSAFLGTVNAAHGQFCMNFSNVDSLRKAHNDLKHMADLCYLNKNYNLSVKFRDFGTFCYGQDIKAQWGLDDEKIEAFSQKYVQTDMYSPGDKSFNDIATWFDRIQELFEDYIRDGNKEYKLFDNCILKFKKSREIKELLHKYIDSQSKPQHVLKPLAAAVMAGCISKPSLEDFNAEFKKNINNTSFHRYVKAGSDLINPYDMDAAYAAMLQEFKDL